MLRISAPRGISQAVIDEFVRKNAAWIARQREARKRSVYLPEGTGTQEHYLNHKENARTFVSERVMFWNAKLGFTFSKIVIRNQVSRWGSCSKKGILNFNYRLLLLPPELADYVVVHELCHLKHFNHSKKFWNEVEKIMPDYKIRFKELRKYRLN